MWGDYSRCKALQKNAQNGMEMAQKWPNFGPKHFFLSAQEAPKQGGRTWQAFGGGKNGHKTFRQARIYNFRDKCVVFARNLNFRI